MAEGPQENPTFAARAFIGGYVLAIAFKAADRFDVGSYAQFAAYTLAALDLTGHREQLSVANPINFAEQWKIDEIEPITAGASVMLVYEIQPQLSISDFLSVWGTFELHVIYDDKEYVKKYLPDYINDKMTREMPGIVGPRVTKKPPDK